MKFVLMVFKNIPIFSNKFLSFSGHFFLGSSISQRLKELNFCFFLFKNTQRNNLLYTCHVYHLFSYWCIYHLFGSIVPDNVFFLIFISCICAGICVLHAGASGIQKRVSNFLGLKSQVAVNDYIWVLRTELRSLARTLLILLSWAIAIAMVLLCFRESI